MSLRELPRPQPPRQYPPLDPPPVTRHLYLRGLGYLLLVAGSWGLLVLAWWIYRTVNP
jgi:hypothetical protein